MAIAKEFFRNTFDAAPVCMMVSDADGRFIRVNRAMCEFAGYSERELLTMNCLDITHPDDIKKSELAWRSLLDSRCHSYQMEKRYVCRDGRALWVDVFVSIVRDKFDEVVNFIGVFNGATGSKESALKLADSRRKLRALAAHQEEILELERKHIAREIHDELGQLLTALKMDISLARLRFGENRDLSGMLDGMHSLTEKSINVVRQVASNLRPAVLDHGLVSAIEWLVADFSKRWSIRCKLDIGNSEVALGELQSTAVFRVIQESLTNVARHAKASEVLISKTRNDQQLEFVVKDNGRGFDTVAVSKARGFGLFGMRERMLNLGGSLRIDSALGKGTSVTIRLPLSSGTGS